LHNFFSDAPPQGAAWRAGYWGLSSSLMAFNKISILLSKNNVDCKQANGLVELSYASMI
jgi:hypothetical protein